MESKNKAEELVEKFRDEMPEVYFESINYNAIECAKIAVDEIIEQYIKFQWWHDRVGKEGIEYWQEVKNELNNM